MRVTHDTRQVRGKVGIMSAPAEVRNGAHMDKVCRNDPCPCGSGKKYKRCCLGHGSAAIGFTQEERQSALDKLEEFVSAELENEEDEAYETFYAEWHDRLDELEERGEQWPELSDSVYDMGFFLDCELADGRRAID